MELEFMDLELQIERLNGMLTRQTTMIASIQAERDALKAKIDLALEFLDMDFVEEAHAALRGGVE